MARISTGEKASQQNLLGRFIRRNSWTALLFTTIIAIISEIFSEFSWTFPLWCIDHARLSKTLCQSGFAFDVRRMYFTTRGSKLAVCGGKKVAFRNGVFCVQFCYFQLWIDSNSLKQTIKSRDWYLIFSLAHWLRKLCLQGFAFFLQKNKLLKKKISFDFIDSLQNLFGGPEKSRFSLFRSRINIESSELLQRFWNLFTVTPFIVNFRRYTWWKQ